MMMSSMERNKKRSLNNYDCRLSSGQFTGNAKSRKSRRGLHLRGNVVRSSSNDNEEGVEEVQEEVSVIKVNADAANFTNDNVDYDEMKNGEHDNQVISVVLIVTFDSYLFVVVFYLKFVNNSIVFVSSLII